MSTTMAELTYPNRVNSQGMPTLSGTPVAEGTTLTITFKPHLVPSEDWSGAFWVSVNGTITASTTQLVVFATEGENRVPTPLYLYSGGQATATNLATTATGSVFECFYNADTKRLQLVGML